MACTCVCVCVCVSVCLCVVSQGRVFSPCLAGQLNPPSLLLRRSSRLPLTTYAPLTLPLLIRRPSANDARGVPRAAEGGVDGPQRGTSLGGYGRVWVVVEMSANAVACSVGSSERWGQWLAWDQPKAWGCGRIWDEPDPRREICVSHLPLPRFPHPFNIFLQTVLTT